LGDGFVCATLEQPCEEWGAAVAGRASDDIPQFSGTNYPQHDQCLVHLPLEVVHCQSRRAIEERSRGRCHGEALCDTDVAPK
jgi:hypothetical protein